MALLLKQTEVLSVFHQFFNTVQEMRVSAFDILQWTLSPLAMVAVLVVGVPYVKSTPASYQSSAKIWIQAQYPMPGGSDDNQSGGSGGLYLPLISFFNSPIKTAAELIRSETVLTEARNLLLKSIPEAECPTVDRMRGGLKIEDIKDTDVLAVKYTDRDPHIACMVLQGVIDGFLKLNSVQASANALRSREFLEVQVAKSLKSLRDFRTLLKAFQSKYGKMDLPAETTEFMERVARKEQDVESTKIDLARTTERARFLGNARSAIENLSVKDPLVTSLQDRLAVLDMQVVQNSSKLKDSHPTMIALHASADNTRRALETRLAFYRQGQVPPDMVATTLPHEKTEKFDKLTDARADSAGLAMKLEKEVEDLARLRAKVMELPELQVRFAEYKHDEAQALQSVTDYERRLQNARLIETVAAGVTNIQIIDRPNVPDIAQGPSGTLLTGATGILGLFLGTAVWFVFAFLDPSIGNFSNIGSLIKFPLIATLGRLSASTDKNKSRFERLRLALMPKLAQCHNRLAVISPVEGDGKTSCCLGLARAVSDSGHSVLLIEDVTSGSFIHEKLGLTPPAVTQFQLESCQDAITPINSNLGIFAIGRMVSERWSWDSDDGRKLLEKLSSLAEILIFDTEPMSKSARALSLFSSHMLPLVVVRWRRTPKDNLSVLASQLELQRVENGYLTAWDTEAAKIQTAQPTAVRARPEVLEEEAWA